MPIFALHFLWTSFVILCSFVQTAISDIRVISVSLLVELSPCIPMWHLAFLRFIRSSLHSFVCLPPQFLISQHLVASQLLWVPKEWKKQSAILDCASVFLFKSALNAFSDSKSPYIQSCLMELRWSLYSHPGFTTMNHLKNNVMLTSFYTFRKTSVLSLNSSLKKSCSFFTSQWFPIQTYCK